MSEVYLLDANAFIQPKQKFYAFDICPGYWAALISHQRSGRVHSIDRVRDEIEEGGDDLWTWARDTFPAAGFATTRETGILSNYARLQSWVATSVHYTAVARQEFAEERNADGWLVAYAMKFPGTVIVTMEDFNAAKQSKVPIPNIAAAFGVESITPFDMLRRLHVELQWREPE
jgi:hypothetical protein